jgi:dipeptidyl aminopeptidase/acylaminoacyl peptidase
MGSGWNFHTWRRVAGGAIVVVVAVAVLGMQSSGAAVPGRNGLIAFDRPATPGGPKEIFAMTPSGTHLRQLTRSTLSSTQPSFSPGGKQIVFVQHGESVRPDLWTMNVDGSHQRRLTSTTEIAEVDPVWSPDGKVIAFTVDHPAKLRGIWVVNSHGGHPRRVAGGDAFQPTWSPDGKRLGFLDGAQNATDWAWDVPAAGGTPRHLTGCGACGFWGGDLAWSPDGRQILFNGLCGGFGGLFLKRLGAKGEGDTPGGGCILNELDHAVWSPDGREILYPGTNPNNIFVGPVQLYVLREQFGHWQCCRTIPNSGGANFPSWQPRPH